MSMIFARKVWGLGFGDSGVVGRLRESTLYEKISSMLFLGSRLFARLRQMPPVESSVEYHSSMYYIRAIYSDVQSSEEKGILHLTNEIETSIEST